MDPHNNADRQPPHQEQQQPRQENPNPAAHGFPIEQWYMDIPPVTRTLGTLVLATTLAVQFKLVSPFQLMFHCMGKGWRLAYRLFITRRAAALALALARRGNCHQKTGIDCVCPGD